MMSSSIIRRCEKIVGNCISSLSRRRYCSGGDGEVLLRSPSPLMIGDREVRRSPSPLMMLAPSSSCMNKGGAGGLHASTSTTVYNFYDPVEGRVVNLNSGKQEQVHGRHMELVGASHGWLAWFNRDNGNVFLLNPLSGRRIDLPVPPVRPHKVTLSCSPDEEDKECCALMNFVIRHGVAFCRPGRSTAWSIPAQPEQPDLNGEFKLYSDFVYSPVHGSFLGFAQKRSLRGGFLEYWDAHDDPSRPRMVRSSTLLGQWDSNINWDKYFPTHLVPYMDGLFVVRIQSKDELFVFRADCDVGKLELCSSLDDLAMFVGYYNSLAVQASSSNRLKPNSVYTISGRYNYRRSRYDRIYKYTSEDYEDRWNTTWFTPSLH